MGGYNTNEIFRVDRGFVAQVQGSAAIFAKRNQIASAAVVSRVARGAHAARRTRRTPHAARRTLSLSDIAPSSHTRVDCTASTAAAARP